MGGLRWDLCELGISCRIQGREQRGEMNMKAILLIIVGLVVLLVVVKILLVLAVPLLFMVVPVLLTVAGLLSCIRSNKPGNTKLLWIIVIILAPFVGPLLWFFWGKQNT